MTTSTTARERLHRLVDELPDGELHAAARFLEYLHDIGSGPLMRLLDEAPEDDELPSEEEERQASESRAAYFRGERGVPGEQLEGELLR